MQSLGAKFSNAQISKLKELSIEVGVSNSKVARAALRLGMVQINNLSIKDMEKAVDLVLVNDARSKQ